MSKMSHVRNTLISGGSDALAQRRAARGPAPAVLVPLEQRMFTVGRDLSLTHALSQVLDAWQSMAARGEMTEQTLDKFTLLIRRFERYMQLRGAVVLDDITETSPRTSSTPAVGAATVTSPTPPPARWGCAGPSCVPPIARCGS